MPDNQVVDTDDHEQAALTYETLPVDAHMPPQPGGDPVWANVWNPDTNEWAPSNEQHSTFGVAEPSHGDDPTAEPMSTQYGREDDSARYGNLNLLDAVRSPGREVPSQPVRVEHVVHTEEVSSARVRARLMAVTNLQNVVLLEENPNRDRAFLRVFTAASTILLAPLRQGGLPQGLAAAPTLPGAFFPIATADGMFKIEAAGGVEAIGTTAAPGVILVGVWEEIRDSAPGIGL